MAWTARVVDLDEASRNPLEPDIAIELTDGTTTHVIRISGDVTDADWLDDQILALADRIGAVAAVKAVAARGDVFQVDDVRARVEARLSAMVDVVADVVDPVPARVP